MLRRFFIVMMVAAVGLALTHEPADAQRRRERETRITGQGASFPAPLYFAWFREFNRQTDGLRITYQSTGSGAGIRAFIDRIADFAASDAAMTDTDIARVDGGVVVLPMTAGEIVIAYNVAGVDALRLPRDVYPLIFSGDVTRWNDPRIVKANPGVALPDQPITVVVRSDSAGTTFVFTKHLSAINASFRETIGTGTTVPWPRRPNVIAAPRNDGMAATINQTPGSIGFMEFFFAASTGLPMALLENAAGNFVAAGEGGGQAALASADLKGDDLRIWVPDPSHPEAYPITTLTWMLFFRRHGNEQVAAGLRTFVDWAMVKGQDMAEEFGYTPLPPALVERVRAEIPKIQ